MACAGNLRAAEPQVFDLGNGAEIVVNGGRIEVRDRAGAKAGSASNSVSSSSDGKGGTTATVTSERDGQRVTRTVTISPDGKVTVDGKEAAPSAQAAPVRTGGWMGVRSAPVSEAMRAQVDIPAGQGVVLEVVAPEGPAARAGLAVHDIVLTMNSEAVKSVEDFRSRLQAAKPDQQVEVGYLRKGKQGQATVTLGSAPAATSTSTTGIESEAERLLREMQERMKSGKAGGKTVVVGPDGKTTVSEGADAFDLLLKDPNVPEAMKEQIRKAREAVQPKAEGR